MSDSYDTKKREEAFNRLRGCIEEAACIDKQTMTMVDECVKSGDPEAMWIQGLCMEYGMGCDMDSASAEKMYEKAAGCGSPVGQFFVKHKDRYVNGDPQMIVLHNGKHLI